MNTTAATSTVKDEDCSATTARVEMWVDVLCGANVELTGNHIVITGNAKCPSLDYINNDAIFDLFKEYGAILFRNLNIGYSAFDSITKEYCSSFLSQAAGGRKRMINDPATQTVNLGNSPFPYHPELSQYPWQPDIAWFCCTETPQHKNEGTIICDGVELVKLLDPNDRESLANNQLVYTSRYSLGSTL